MDLRVGLGSTYNAHDEESKAFVHGLGWKYATGRRRARLLAPEERLSRYKRVSGMFLIGIGSKARPFLSPVLKD